MHIGCDTAKCLASERPDKTYCYFIKKENQPMPAKTNFEANSHLSDDELTAKICAAGCCALAYAVHYLRAPAEPEFKAPFWLKDDALICLTKRNQFGYVSDLKISHDRATFVLDGLRREIVQSTIDQGLIRPAVIRPWTLEEARAHVGKQLFSKTNPVRFVMLYTTQSSGSWVAKLFRGTGTNVTEATATLEALTHYTLHDGSPCGVYTVA